MTPGRELDALIAEKVMGLRCPDWISCGRGRGAWEHSLKHYSTDISASWEVVEKFNGDAMRILPLCALDKDEWSGWMVELGDQDVCAKTLPHAICLAALKALEV